MRTQIHAGIAAVGLTLALALPSIATAPAAGDGAPAPGEIVNHTFSTSPMNSGGLKSLAELRGRPVLIEFWGVR